jgi:phage shock protein C
MTCTNCHREVTDFSNFCNFCGARQHAASRAYKRLLRSSVDRKIAGVCGGIAEYLEIDSTVVRLLWLILILIPVPVVPAIVAYLVAWAVMPQAPAPAATAPPVVPHSTQVA